MDGDTSTSHHDQISLYGLFGDSSATLQGLNDQLSPSLLQQSPPCGSTLTGQNTISKTIITSPPKSFTNGLQHGVLLSDLADRSPSAGSITASSFCNYVSYGNQRCTNLVNIKGRKYCNTHSTEPTIGVSLVKKAIFKKPKITSHLKAAEGFLPITQSEIIGGKLSSNTAKLNSGIRITPSSMFATVTSPRQSISTKMNGYDTPDNKTSIDEVSNAEINSKSKQVHLVKKVGQKITVSTRPIALKVSEAVSPKLATPMATGTGNVGVQKLQNQKHSVDTVQLNVSRPLVSTYNVPYYKKTETVTLPSKMKEARFPTNKHASPQSSSTAVMQGVSTISLGKTGVLDEATMNKLLEAIDTNKELSLLDRMALLQSMVVTVVQAPATGGSISLKKQPGNVVRRLDTANMKSTLSTTIVKSPSIVNTVSSQIVNCTKQPLNVGTLDVSATETSSVPSITGNDSYPTSINCVQTAVKGKKNVTKSGQKRKQKSPENYAVKISKTECKAKVQPDKKLGSSKPSDKTKQKKSTSQSRLSIFIPTARPKLLKIPSSASDSLKELIHFLNSKTLDQDLFKHRKLPIEEYSGKIDKSKLKSLLLKKHAARQRAKAQDDKNFIDYEKCLEDINGTNPLNAFSAAGHLLRLFSNGRGNKHTIHHERILETLYNPFDSEEITRELLDNADDTTILDDKTTYTLDTLLLKNKYDKLKKQLKIDEYEHDLLSHCFKEDPNLTMETVNLYLDSEFNANRAVKTSDLSQEGRCQLSSDSALRCCKRALPYTNYCKEHIWHCETQLLYKLDQNMKAVADIDPEPMVKRPKKRAKLLPLIKKYKKKKKKKVEGSDIGDMKDDISSPASVAPQVELDIADSDGIKTQHNLATADTNVSMLRNERFNLSLGVDDSKQSDTSEEDINLMTNEMLSGVLKELTDDAHDFDLFSESNTEELERALRLADSHVPDEHSESPFGSEQESNSLETKSATESLQNLNTRMLSNPRLNASPDAIVNCDAPKSAEPPPSLEDFKESQIAHYTFGSSVSGVIKKECPNESFPLEEDNENSVISAEDLQDIVGVLERLRAEDVNSPKLPSSPAVDQYTSMLARQLSQEVECESMKREVASTSGVQSMAPPFSNQSQSISTSFNLPSPNFSQASSPMNRVKSVPLYGGNATGNHTLPVSVGVQQLQKTGTVNVRNVVHGSHGVDGKTTTLLQQELMQSNQKNMQRSVNVASTSTGASIQFSRGVTISTFPPSTETKLKGAVKGSAVVKSPTISRTLQGKIPQTPNVVQNQVLPLTLMPTQSQNGNVIKVIVPPGTMVNGANGQQNMLLIPVSALMKSNMQTGGQGAPNNLTSVTVNSSVGVKTQISNVPAGQQFFIVNNTGTGPSQTHLTLVQKPNNAGNQQGILFKPHNATAILKDGSSYVQRQVSQDRLKQMSSTGVKSGLNLQLKQGVVLSDQAGKPSNYPSSSGIPTANVAMQTFSGANITNKAVATSISKMPRSQGGRRKPKNTPRKPKARFDPITRKYVPVTESPIQTSVATIPLPATSNSKMSESLIKFNESALSLQNKVQQIDSVLSSLNAATKKQSGGTKGQQDGKNKGSSYTVRSIVHPNNNIQNLKSLTNIKTVSPKPISTFPKTVITQAKVIASSNVALLNTMSSSNKSTATLTATTQKTMPLLSTKKIETPLKSMTIPISGSALTSVAKAAKDLGSSGTVHWNQTTTAGPEITTTTLTVPVYITGAIPASPWGSELTLSRSLSGTSLPVILPARKISPHCQLPQRVLLGSIGSLAVPGRTKTSTSTGGSSSILKHTVISVPQSIVTMPKSKSLTSSVAESKSTSTLSNSTVNISLGETAAQRAEAILKFSALTSGTKSTANSIPLLSSPRPAVSGSAVTVEKSEQEDSSVSRKKSGRKASHDTILHDPLMFDPTLLDHTSPEKSG